MDQDVNEEIVSESLAAEMREQFRPITLAILSIVQGVALAELASVVASGYQQFTVAQWLLAITTFGALIGIWHHFVTDSLVFAWIPDLIDAVLPFAVGAIELYMCHAIAINMSAWLLGAAVLVGLGSLAYRYPEQHGRDLPTASAFVFHVQGHRRFGERYAVAGALLYLVLALVSLHDGIGMHGMKSLIVALLAFAWELGFLVRAHIYSHVVVTFARRLPAR